jgi:hypothetical protein
MSNDSSNFSYTPSPADSSRPRGRKVQGVLRRGLDRALLRNVGKPTAGRKPSGTAVKSDGVSGDAAAGKAAGETAAAPSAANTRNVPLVPWGPIPAVAYTALVYFSAQIAASFLIIFYTRLRGWDHSYANDWLDHSIVSQFFFVLLAEALTFGAVWLFVSKRGASLRAIGWRRLRAKDTLYTLGGFFVYLAVYGVLLTLITNLVPSFNLDQKQQLGFDGAAGTDNLLLTFMSLVVLPPLVEETVFRGFVFGALRGKLKFVWAALLTSVLFASAHLQFGSGAPLLWAAALDTFTLSMVLCFLRERTGSLWPGILLHGLKNGIAFVSLFILATH